MQSLQIRLTLLPASSPPHPPAAAVLAGRTCVRLLPPTAPGWWLRPRSHGVRRSWLSVSSTWKGAGGPQHHCHVCVCVGGVRVRVRVMYHTDGVIATWMTLLEGKGVCWQRPCGWPASLHCTSPPATLPPLPPCHPDSYSTPPLPSLSASGTMPSSSSLPTCVGLPFAPHAQAMCHLPTGWLADRSCAAFWGACCGGMHAAAVKACTLRPLTLCMCMHSAWWWVQEASLSLPAPPYPFLSLPFTCAEGLSSLLCHIVPLALHCCSSQQSTCCPGVARAGVSSGTEWRRISCNCW